MIWRLFRKARPKAKTDSDLRKAASQQGAKRDRQPRTQEQSDRDPQVDSAKPADN